MSAEGGNGFAGSGNDRGDVPLGGGQRPQPFSEGSDALAGGGPSQSSADATRVALAEAQRVASESLETMECPSCGHTLLYARFGDQAEWLHVGSGGSIPWVYWPCSGLAEQPSSPGDTDE